MLLDYPEWRDHLFWKDTWKDKLYVLFFPPTIHHSSPLYYGEAARVLESYISESIETKAICVYGEVGKCGCFVFCFFCNFSELTVRWQESAEKKTTKKNNRREFR